MRESSMLRMQTWFGRETDDGLHPGHASRTRLNTLISVVTFAGVHDVVNLPTLTYIRVLVWDMQGSLPVALAAIIIGRDVLLVTGACVDRCRRVSSHLYIALISPFSR